MQGEYGRQLKISIFGESHRETMGVTLHGLAPGLSFDWEKVNDLLVKRRPQKEISTSRVEADDYEVVSGYFNGYTTGTPLTILVKNKEHNSNDYQQVKEFYRPAHADYSGTMKYKGFEDYRGGGHFSGRVTVLLVLAGALCLQILEKKNIHVKTHILKTRTLTERRFADEQTKLLDDFLILDKADFPALEKAKEMKEEIVAAKNNDESLGAVMETVIVNLPAGIGEPFFDSLESMISHLVFSIPAVKGISFGTGFDYVNYLGSEVSDGLYYKDGQILTSSNHNGGIIGGITTGMPCRFDTVIKPTATINQEVETVERLTNKAVKMKFVGRHDPAIYPRAAVIIDAVSAIALIDTLAMRYGYLWMAE